jgi:guanylate kinase
MAAMENAGLMAETSNKGVLLIISGPSGVGKTTICHELVKRLNAFLSVSVTTRPKRDNEVDGQAYTFLSKDEFEARLRAGELLEYAQVYGGHCYGTPAGPVREALETGRGAILEIEINGAMQVVRTYPEAVCVYILAPTPEEQAGRLEGRNMDSPEAMSERLAKADGEIRYAQECGVYQHFVVNHVVQETVDRIVRLVREKQQA